MGRPSSGPVSDGQSFPQTHETASDRDRAQHGRQQSRQSIIDASTTVHQSHLNRPRNTKTPIRRRQLRSRESFNNTTRALAVSAGGCRKAQILQVLQNMGSASPRSLDPIRLKRTTNIPLPICNSGIIHATDHHSRPFYCDSSTRKRHREASHSENDEAPRSSHLPAPKLPHARISQSINGAQSFNAL